MRNESMCVFDPSMTPVGVHLCLVTNVGLVKTHNLDGILFLRICAILSSICIHWLIVFFVNHTASLAVCNVKIQQFWKKILQAKVDRLKLRSLQVFGFTLGQFTKIAKTTGLDLLMIILNNTITVLIS